MTDDKRTTIKFIRKYECYGETNYDIVYANNRLYAFVTNLPKTAARFIQQADAKEQYDSFRERTEIIYTARQP